MGGKRVNTDVIRKTQCLEIYFINYSQFIKNAYHLLSCISIKKTCTMKRETKINELKGADKSMENS